MKIKKTYILVECEDPKDVGNIRELEESDAFVATARVMDKQIEEEQKRIRKEEHERFQKHLEFEKVKFEKALQSVIDQHSQSAKQEKIAPLLKELDNALNQKSPRDNSSNT